ncbi:hypothetical protein FOVG_18497 [Fusarium oxysporum f. sp. pisi HDV247]|uniref:Uncharacterized protein n=1 Tax=Fusarium oxysporum f. sp. pisi HDV247 TaxID=1080344 RepID=W9NBC3_FUSOX|nr:hypothetical protein FOVG_18497 [Fusarium oxysporum f. sp. pisi HDV247]RKK74376.1 hypothetical protein BFJ71_g17276 [Fusarium oxysporum]
MWPSKLHDRQADDHDVEQNETTPWLQHTGWPRLFHGRPLGIIAATARKPKPAWNEDYLLGQWHDTALQSLAVVEAQLRVILRGVDIMVDRACFTLVKTSYRSRCWLNTSWKDTFWPHEFKAVNCLKRYVDVWKRFICFVNSSKVAPPAILNMIASGVAHLIEGVDVDRPSNALTLTLSYHVSFGDFRVYF